jgi:fused signal recognition particle receptor
MGFFDRLRDGLARTTQQVFSRFHDITGRADSPERRGRPLDAETLEAIEELLISADVGVAASERIVRAVGERARGGQNRLLRDAVKEEILTILESVEPQRPGAASDGAQPAGATNRVEEPTRVMLIVGVNGTGKTTTVGKLAHLLKAGGANPLICAADTFRAAAVDQLEIWARRAGVDIVRAREGADPAAVVFDAIVAGRARGRSPILVDTAGRLHTRVNLMEELAKIRRIAAREVAGAPHDVLLVLDATVGQNGISQAREFMESAGVNGIVLAKLDGTAKGGVVVAIAQDLHIPIRYVGVGESLDDLIPFSPRDYVDALFEEKPQALPPAPR